MVAILIAAIFLTGISPQLYRSTSEIEQLKMAAQKIMAQILLSPGDPEDWGKNIAIKATNLSSLGLAVSTVFTREAFVLDPDKVQRLNQKLPGNLYISPERFSELLGLGSRDLGLNYGVKIDFIPALKATVYFNGDSKIIVNVASEQGAPLASANVTLGAFYVMNNSKIIFCNKTESADLYGNCTIELNYPNPSFLVVVVNYHGLQTMNATNINSHIGYLIGNYLLVESGLKVVNMSVTQVFVISSNKGPKLMSVSCNITGCQDITMGYEVYDMGYEEPNMVAVVALAEDGRLIAAYKDIPESYSSAAGEVYAPLIYMLERSVKIGLSTYTLRLKVWRMEW
ncbi:MAG: hypothetical protein QXL45_03760 [Candidatus Bathyarchaeia archaeon]